MLNHFLLKALFSPCGCPVVRLQAPVPCEKFASFPLHLHFQFWGSFAISLEKIAKQTEGNTQVLVCPRMQNDCTVSELTYKLHLLLFIFANFKNFRTRMSTKISF